MISFISKKEGGVLKRIFLFQTTNTTRKQLWDDDEIRTCPRSIIR